MKKKPQLTFVTTSENHDMFQTSKKIEMFMKKKLFMHFVITWQTGNENENILYYFQTSFFS